MDGDKLVRGSLDPGYDSPYCVQLITPASVQFEGKETCIYASHCKKTDKIEAASIFSQVVSRGKTTPLFGC